MYRICIAGLLLFAGCARQPRVPGPPVYGVEYAYQRLSETEVQVVAKTPRGLDLAIEEVCGKQACTVQPVGMMYLITIPGVQ